MSSGCEGAAAQGCWGGFGYLGFDGERERERENVCVCVCLVERRRNRALAFLGLLWWFFVLMHAVATHVQANRGHFGRDPYGQWPPGGVIRMRTQSEGAVEERRNGKCRQGRASGGGCGVAVAVVPAGMKRKGSSRNGCDPGPSTTAAAASSPSKGVLSGMKERKGRGDGDGPGSSGRGRLRGGGVPTEYLRLFKGRLPLLTLELTHQG